MKRMVFWVEMPCSLERALHFGVISISPAASTVFLLVLLFGPEDGGDILLQNIRLQPNYMALKPGKP
jgi:hypothetical protein